MDKSKTLGSQRNPVVPDPTNPENSKLYYTNQSFYGLNLYGHNRTKRNKEDIFQWKERAPGNGLELHIKMGGPEKY